MGNVYDFLLSCKRSEKLLFLLSEILRPDSEILRSRDEVP